MRVRTLKRIMFPNRHLLLIGLVTVAFFGARMYIQSKFHSHNDEIVFTSVKNDSGNSITMVVDNRTWCKIPKLDPFHPEIRQFIKTYPPLDCGDEIDWIYVRNRRIFISEEAERKFGKISCKFTDFRRTTDFEVIDLPYPNSNNGTDLMGDFFEANCQTPWGFFGKKYDNYHMTILPSSDAILRARQKSAAKKLKKPPPELNIYFFMLESTSHMNAVRKLPKFYEFIKKDLQGVIFQGYNIVGDGTPQTLIPVLTGKTELELPLTQKRYPGANFVDVYPFIWNKFHDAGYVSLYGEDAWETAAFVYRLKGFNVHPTDHYLRPFFAKVAGLCTRSEPLHKAYFRMGHEFFKNYPPDLRKFALLFAGQYLSHSDLNRIQVADLGTIHKLYNCSSSNFLEHLTDMRSSGFLNQTLLIVLADHGNRYAELRATHQGKLEERMPLMAMVAPIWFREKYPQAWKNVEKNAQRLTTPFDIHETLQMILNWRVPKVGNVDSRGISLFDEVSENRTCAQAGLDPHWCVCLAWETLPVSDSVGTRVVLAIIQRMNKETETERRHCSPLDLRKIDSIQRLAPNEKLMSFKRSKDKDGFVPDFGEAKPELTSTIYQVKFWTKPAAGLYEATARMKGTEVFVDLEVVSRINKYGDTPHCVLDKNLAKWCVCYDKI